MDKKLIDAASKGDVNQLHNLIKDYPLLLRAMSLAGEDQNLLHIACFGRNLDFVKEVLSLNPDFVTELNKDGFSPLHIASGNGDLEIVIEILRMGYHLCLIKGKDKRIPLHYAVVRGRIRVIRELLSVCLDSINESSARGENCLHLAVKNNQFDAFKVLVQHVVLHKKDGLLNMKDQQGNNILHLAAFRKQYEVFDMLLDEKFGYKGKIELNPLNKRGLTPIDVLASQGGDSEIEEMLRLAGAKANEELMNQFPQQHSLPITSNSSGNESRRERRRRERSKYPSKQLKDYFKYDKIKDSPGKVRNILLVIAVLIATATYQAVLSPPGGVWQDDFSPDNSNISTSGQQSPPHTAGQAVMGTQNEVAYSLFLLFNSIGFFTSLHMMNFVTLGLPMRFELRVSMMALIGTYNTCMIAITPNGIVSLLFIIMCSVMPLLNPLLTIVVRDYKKGWRCLLPSRGEEGA